MALQASKHVQPVFHGISCAFPIQVTAVLAFAIAAMPEAEAAPKRLCRTILALTLQYYRFLSMSFAPDSFTPSGDRGPPLQDNG